MTVFSEDVGTLKPTVQDHKRPQISQKKKNKRAEQVLGITLLRNNNTPILPSIYIIKWYVYNLTRLQDIYI